MAEYAQTFFLFLQPISRFGLYLGNENRPSETFRLGMPHMRFVDYMLSGAFIYMILTSHLKFQSAQYGI